MKRCKRRNKKSEIQRQMNRDTVRETKREETERQKKKREREAKESELTVKFKEKLQQGGSSTS